MSRQSLDVVSSGQLRETINTEDRTREHWLKHNRELIWDNAIGPIQGRMYCICQNKNELARKLMDTQDEYFKFCKSAPPEPLKDDGSLWVRIGPDPCDQCDRDPTTPMKTPPPEQFNLLFEGISHDGRGSYGYLQNRYNSGLPETRFCYPPTTNSEYAWKLKEMVQHSSGTCRPNQSGVGSFYRARGQTVCTTDYAQFHCAS